MAKTKKPKKKAKEAAGVARPYVQKLIEDDDLRENLREAYESARDAVDRAVDGKGTATAVFEDKKVQNDLRDAAQSLRAATEALREPQKRKAKKGGSKLGRLLLVAIIGAVLAIALSEDLRKAVLDRLFGAEEEFEYSSTSTTTSPAPEASPSG